MRLAIFLCLITLCVATQAANETTHEVTISAISSYHNYAVIAFGPAFSHSQSECLSSKTRAIIDYEDGAMTKKEMYALALAAATSNKTIKLGISGCFDNHPRVYRVDVTF